MKTNGQRVIAPEAYGTWVVTTEGDCEGRSTQNLGTHTGFLDEIAFALAGKAYYGLRFSQVNPLALVKTGPTGTKVQVSLDIETGSWNMDHKEPVQYFKNILSGRNVIVRDGTYYACVELVSGLSPEAQADAAQRVLIQSALSKLTADEIEALNLTK